MWIVGGVGTVMMGLSGFTFNHLRKENERLREDLDRYQDRIDEDLEKQRLELITLFKESEERILTAIIEVKNTMTPYTHCESRQEIWLERFGNFQGVVENSSDHNEQQHSEIVKELKELTKCVQHLAAGSKKCD